MTFVSRVVGFFVVGGLALYGFKTLVEDILDWRDAARELDSQPES